MCAMKKKKYLPFLLILLFLFVFNISSVSGAEKDPLEEAIEDGEFVVAHNDKYGCPGMNSPHIYYDKMSGNCGCPTKPKIKIKDCAIEVSCDLDDDDENIVKLTIPCPTAVVTDPKYPLVKMLAGTLVEWRVDNERVKAPPSIKYASKGASAYGTEVFVGFDLDIIVSTVDTGKKWDIKKANSIVAGIEKHSRTNIEFTLDKKGFGVKVMTPKDIYEAYKTKSEEVQAYLALSQKGWGERPWTSYKYFVENFCKNSSKQSDCQKGLEGRSYLKRVGNYYLGNGNPTIVGLYSEASSHTAHGASVTNDKGQAAWGIKFKSTFYVYFHASWRNHYTYGNDAAEFLGDVCVRYEHYWEDICPCENNQWGFCGCGMVRVQRRRCVESAPLYGCGDDFVPSGKGESKEDCKECLKFNGYLNTNNEYSVKPYPVSFYQSQPLLINEN